MLERNPGVTAIWWSLGYKPFNAGNGVLFRLGPALKVQWIARGRPATADEVLESIDSGMPHLRALAEQEGPEALAELAAEYKKAMKLLPRPAAETGGDNGSPSVVSA
jgi:hypothetical protein